MRGGGYRPRPFPGRARGRSPHARGRRPHRRAGRPHRRSIPACAGEAVRRVRVVRQSGVDPRMRGGGYIRHYLGTSMMGRSPHARGRPSLLGAGRHNPRSIPACAGEAQAKAGQTTSVRVDPRMRGGGGSSVITRQTVPGRSPHARGRPGWSIPGVKRSGSIPACAGEAMAAATLPDWIRVDPRMRGGGITAKRPSGRVGGRSPHARGRRPFLLRNLTA